MTTLATLVVSLIGDVSGFQKSMGEAENTAKGAGSRIGNALSGAANSVADLGKIALGVGVAGITAVTTAAIGSIAAFNSWADELDSLGDVLGTSADESAALAVAIKGVGGDVEGITGQMAKLTQGLIANNGKLGPAGELATKMGIAFKGANGQLLPTTTILENVANKIAAMPDGLEKTAALTDLFGKSGKDLSDTMNALANGGLENARKKAEALGLAIGDEGVNKSIEFGKSVETLKMTLEGIAVSIGSVIMPVLVPLIQQFAEWAVSVMPQVRAAIETVFGWIAANVGPIISSLLPIFQAVFGWLQTNVVPIIQGLIAAFQQIAGWLSANGPGMAQGLVGGLQEAFNSIQPILNSIITVIRTIFGAISDFLREHGDEIRDFIVEAWNKISAIVSGVVEIIRNVVTAVWGGIADFVQNNQELIKGIITGVWESIRLFISVVLDVIRGIVDAVLALTKGDVQGALNAIGGIFINIWNDIKGTVQKAVETMREILLIAWAAIKSGVETAWNGIRTAIENAWNSVMDFFRSLPERLVQIGKDIIEGLIRGIKEAGDRIGEALGNIVNSALEDLKKNLGISSPSAVMASEVGEPLIAGIIAGIQAMTPELRKALIGTTNAIFDTILKGTEAFNALANFTAPGLDAMTAFIASLNTIVAQFVVQANLFVGHGLGAAKKFADGAGQIFSTVGTAVEALVSLADFQGVPEAALAAFGAGLTATITQLIAIARSFEVQAVAAAATFSGAAGTAVDVIGNSVGGLAKLANFKGVSDTAIAAFGASLGAIMETLKAIAVGFSAGDLAAITGFAEAAERIVAAGRNIIRGIVIGIEAEGEAVTAALRGVIDRAITQIEHDLGIASPSATFATMGQQMMAGLATGIGQGADLPQIALDRISANLKVNAAGATPGAAGATITYNNYISDTLAARMVLEQQRNDALRSIKEAM